MIYRYLLIILGVCLAIYGACDAGAHKKGEGITIPDIYLRAVIEDSLNKARGEVITAAEMATLTRLEAPNSRVRDLTGIEYATELTVLNLGDVFINGNRINSNEISDISPLSGLVKLTELYIHRNQIWDISSLSNLTELEKLDVSANFHISDISPLSGMTKLRTLYLYTNEISDLSPLSDLTNLRWLSLSNNLIWDISDLASLTELRGLALNINAVSDISHLSGMIYMERLNIWDCDIVDLSPLVENAGLRGEKDFIDVRDNPLSETSLNTHIPTLRERGVRVRLDN
ncbi:MAG: leucine-rich repeat domain-containing protein [Gemmatimonadota bacterium]|nr:leucine-rich repeat domain-containing protein [Gemmatimonadota bacterium]